MFPDCFSKNGRVLTVDELMTLLKTIIREFPRSDIHPPELAVPKRASLPVIGYLSREVVALDVKWDKLKEEMINQLANKRVE